MTVPCQASTFNYSLDGTCTLENGQFVGCICSFALCLAVQHAHALKPIFAAPDMKSKTKSNLSIESRRPVWCKQLLRARLRDTVWQWEFEVLREQLLNVRALHIICLLQLHNSQNVYLPEAGAMAGGHVLIEGLDSVGA